MNKKILFLLMISIFVISLATNVFAQELPGAIQELIDAIGGKDFGQLYQDYQKFFDFVIFLIFFIGIAQLGLGRMEQFKNRGGKAVIIAIGLSLSFGLTWWAQSKNISIIEQLGPFAAILFVVVIMYTVYKIFAGFFKAETALSKAEVFLIAFAIAWYILSSVLPDGAQVVLGVPGVGAVVRLIAAAGLIALIWNIGKKIIGAFGGGGKRPPSAGGAKKGTEKGKKTAAGKQAIEKEEIKEERDIEKKLKDLEKRFDKLTKGKNTKGAWKKVEKDIKKIYNDMKELGGLEKKEYVLEGMKFNKESMAVLQEEQKLLKGFNKLITELFKEVEIGGPTNLIKARNYAVAARQIIKQIIRIDKRQKGRP